MVQAAKAGGESNYCQVAGERAKGAVLRNQAGNQSREPPHSVALVNPLAVLSGLFYSWAVGMSRCRWLHKYNCFFFTG